MPALDSPLTANRPGPSLGVNGHIPSLDGLRAVSILLVILGHLSGTRGFVKMNLQVGDYALLGVVVFFVISGFLITRLLISEDEARGHVSLKLFYERRGLRILPASYFYLFVLVVLSFFNLIHLKSSDIVCGFFYVMNYLPGRSWPVGHLWSLSVEEQFYLLWPFAFAHLRFKNRHWVLLGVICFAVIARLSARLWLIGTPYRDMEMFPMVADSLATGCLLATQKEWLESQSWYLKLFRPGPSIAIALIVLLLNRYMGYSVVGIFGTVLLNLGLAILIHRCVYCADRGFGRLLNWRPLAFVGVLSYSLYLWQQLFLNRSSGAWINAFPQNLIFAVGAALVSYFALEKPLMKMRARLRARSIAPPRELQGPVDLYVT